MQTAGKSWKIRENYLYLFINIILLKQKEAQLLFYNLKDFIFKQQKIVSMWQFFTTRIILVSVTISDDFCHNVAKINCHVVTVLRQKWKLWQFSPIFVTAWQKYFCHVVAFNSCDKNYWHRVFLTQCVKNNENWHSLAIIFATKLSHCTMGYFACLLSCLVCRNAVYHGENLTKWL